MNLKILTDILMYADFVYLMLEGTTRNLTCHGIFGALLFALFIFHHILNRWFYKVAFSGRWNARRVVLNVTDWLLFLLMILMAVSSVMMSGLVFDWSPVRTTQHWRTLHLLSTSWGFMVMSFHVALHTASGLKKLAAKCSGALRVLFFSAMVIVFLAGIFAFYKTQLYIYLFNTGGWKMSAPNLFAGVLEYAGITAGFCAASVTSSAVERSTLKS